MISNHLMSSSSSSSSSDSSKDILKSTGLIGGSKLVSVLVNIGQVKIVAVLLGPSGVGLISLFASLIDVVKGVTSLGINFSAVRDVSEAVGKGDKVQISQTATVVWRWVSLSGILGAVIMCGLSRRLSVYTFGDSSMALEICMLSSVIFFTALSGGQTAILRGHRKMQALAKVNIYSSICSFLISIPVYYIWGVDGIVPVLILVALFTLINSWYFTRSIKLESVSLSFLKSFWLGLGMIKIGVFTVLTSFITAGTLYYVRTFIADNATVEAVGFYATASALSITYLNILLEAMGADYFPRLSSVSTDDLIINKLVNEQTVISLLVGAPLIIAMYTFLELIISLLYTKEFLGSIELIQWMLLGVFMRLMLWPIGYVFLAKAKGKIFVFTQSLWNGVFIALILLGWNRLELKVIGISFASAYIIAFIVNFFLLKSVTHFKYEIKTIKISCLFLVMVIGCFLSKYFSPFFYYLVTSVLFIIGIVISYKHLNQLVPLKGYFSRFLKRK